MTPEGRVKAKVNKLLQPFIDSGEMYRFMPVPAGYGESSLDYLCCYRGQFIAIETKRPGKAPTPRQEFIAERITRAGGKVFVVVGVDDTAELEAYLRG